MRVLRTIGGITCNGEASDPPARAGDEERITPVTHSTIGGGGRGCNKFVPVLGEGGTKIAPARDIFDQPPDGMS